MVKVAKNRFTDLYLPQLLKIEEHAWTSGFYQRQPNKITLSCLLMSFWQMHQDGKNTLRNWTTSFSELTGHCISEQALNGRLNEKSVDALKDILQHALNIRATKKETKSDCSVGTSQAFNRILLRDSTTQKVPRCLKDVLPGNYSNGETTAALRIQSLFNYTQNRWEGFDVSAYTDNDQKAAACIAPNLEKGDLVLQDLGYFSLEWFEQLIENHFLISMYKPGVHIFTPQGERVDLLKLLKNKKEVDLSVLVGAKRKLPMRLVGRKLPKTKAAKKLKEAKEHRHASTNHSKTYYELLKYEIYLTNVEASVLSPKEIAKLYGLRWHIEILFKSWKSHANFKLMFEKGKMHLQRVLFTIYALLIEFVFLKNKVFHFIQKQILLGEARYLSCLKFMDTVNDLFRKILLIRSMEDLIPLIPIFRDKATYKTHSKRQNNTQKYLYVNELCMAS